MVYIGMNRYEKGQIYKIVDIGQTKMYIGSTTEPLSKRMERHRSDYKQYLMNEKHYMSSFSLFDEFGIDNCKILWMQNYPCSSKKELERREGEIQKANDCVNKNIAGRTLKEYYEDKKEILQQKSKIYQETNKDKRVEYMKQYRQEKREQIKQQRKKYNEENKEANKEYKRTHREQINQKQRERRKASAEKENQNYLKQQSQEPEPEQQEEKMNEPNLAHVL